MRKIIACAGAAAIALSSARAEDTSRAAAAAMKALQARGYSRLREIYCDERE